MTPGPIPAQLTAAQLTAAELAVVADRLVGAGVELAGPLAAALIVGGRSNVTYRITDGARQWVLRTPPRAGLTPSAHDIGREYRVTAALAGTPVPVPPVVTLVEDPTLLGVPFSIVEFVAGRTIRTQAELDTLDDAGVAAVATSLARTLAALHRVDPVAVGLAGFARPDGYAQRQLRRWSRQWEIVGAPTLRALAAQIVGRLGATVPGQPATGIVHGDYRIDNTILRDDAAVAAVVDWELCTLGDPVADVAMMCAYRHPAFDLILGTASAWTSVRLPTVDDLAAGYEAAGGARLAHWDFHLALAYFKIGVIAAGIDHRWRFGAATGPGFETCGAAVPHYLELARSALG